MIGNHGIKGVVEDDAAARGEAIAVCQNVINPHTVHRLLAPAVNLPPNGDAAVLLLGALVAILPKGFFCDLRVAFPRDMRWAIEIAHLRDYLELQQMHFSGRLQVTVSVEPEIENCSMMKLILQPLVENAIYHGMSMTEGRGQIRVLGFAEGETLVFQVSDDGIGIAPEELALLTGYINGQNDAFTSIGLKNTNRRIKRNWSALGSC